VQIRSTPDFERWLSGLRDKTAKARIAERINRLARGALGDWKSVGKSVRELRVDHGPGYRVYFVQRGDELIVLLCGGDKSSQQRDIARAVRLAEELED
jgi:putative addiction module killer protein